MSEPHRLGWSMEIEGKTGQVNTHDDERYRSLARAVGAGSPSRRTPATMMPPWAGGLRACGVWNWQREERALLQGDQEHPLCGPAETDFAKKNLA